MGQMGGGEQGEAYLQLAKLEHEHEKGRSCVRKHSCAPSWKIVLHRIA